MMSPGPASEGAKKRAKTSVFLLQDRAAVRAPSVRQLSFNEKSIAEEERMQRRGVPGKTYLRGICREIGNRESPEIDGRAT